MPSRLRGTFFLAASMAVFMIAGYAMNIFLGRHLGPELYGVYGVITSLMTALNIMQVSGVPQAVSKFSAQTGTSEDSVLLSGLKLQLLLTLAISLILLFLAPFLATLFKDHAMTQYLRAVALIFPFYGIYSLYGGYYNGLHKFNRQAAMISIYSVAKAALAIGLVLHFGLYGVIAAFALSPLLALVYGFRTPRGSSQFPLRELAAYSVPLIVFAALSTLQLSVDLFFLKGFLGRSALPGFYTAAQNIAIIPFLTMSALGQVLFPRISRLVSERRFSDASNLISASLRYLIIILIPGAAILACTSYQTTRLLFGKSYEPATAPLKVLLIGYVFLSLFALMANALNGSGHVLKSTIICGLGVIVSLIGCIALIPSLGMTGAALATTVSGVIVSCAALLTIAKKFKITFPWLSLIRTSAASAIIYAVGSFLNAPVFLVPLVYVALIVIYFGLLKTTGELSTRDLILIKNLLPGRWNHETIS